MKNEGRLKYIVAALATLASTIGSRAQNVTMKLDFDNARSETIADNGNEDAAAAEAEIDYRYMVDGRMVDENTADILARHWNIRRIRIERTDSGALVRVKTKGLDQEFLKGNVGGIAWHSRFEEGIDRKYIGGYVLRRDYDSIRRAEHVPDGRLLILRNEHWRRLSPDAVYRLNGRPIDGSSLVYMEGSILQTVDIRFGKRQIRRYGPSAANGVVWCRTYRHLPLITLDGKRIRLKQWIKLCDPSMINMGTTLNYRFLSPIEGCKRYGRRAKYGVIIVRSE